jgi:hypothetical protein
MSSRGCRGLSLLEIAFVAAVAFLLVFVILPSFHRPRVLDKRMICASNLRGIGQAMHIYVAEDAAPVCGDAAMRR